MDNYLFEKAPIPKAYFTLALPVVFSMVVSLIYNMVDTYFIAGTNNTNLIAGVALGAPIFTLMIALGDIFGLGGSSLISRLMGEKRGTDVKRISSVCFYSSIFFGILITVLMLIFRTPILYFLGADADTFAYASQYYTGIVFGAPFIIFSLAPSNILRTEGLAMASMLGSISGVIVNIILDPIFISTLGLGAAGAAYASIIGYVISDIVFIYMVIKKSKYLSMNPGIMGISKKEIGQLLSIGIPASITNLMQSLGVTLTNRYLLEYGSDKIAAMGIAMKINMIAVLLLVGFAFGAQPLIGYNYGAKKTKRLFASIRFAYLFECSLALVLSIILGLLSPWIFGKFINDPSMLETGTLMLRLQLVSMVFIGFIMVSTVIFQSLGKAFAALILSISRQGIIFFLVIVIANKVAHYHGVIAAQAIADILTCLLAVGIVLQVFKTLKGCESS